LIGCGGFVASQQTGAANVRFGSKADIGRLIVWKSAQRMNLKAPMRSSLQLNAGGADDLAPSFAFRSDEGAELLRGVPLRDDADRIEAIHGFLPLEIRDQGGIQLVNDCFGVPACAKNPWNVTFFESNAVASLR
jgi:hypothetical protein